MAGFKARIVPVTPFQQNCCLLWDAETRRGAVIDPGGDVPRILSAIADEKLTIEQIVLTHGHIDHAGGAAALREALSRTAPVPIEGPDARDRFLLDALAEQGRAFGLDDARAVTPDRFLSEGEVLTVAGMDFEILHCPGHTPGSLVYVSRAEKFALVGDVLFRGSVGRTDFPYGDTDALMDSIQTKLLAVGDDVTFICGHGPGSTIGVERARNPFLRGRR